MTEEEKEAIEKIDNSYDDNTGFVECEAGIWNIVTNLISKQQKEIEKKDLCLKACEDNLIKERQLRIKQDKVIDLMAKSWKQDDVRSVEKIKEYFYKKVSE